MESTLISHLARGVLLESQSGRIVLGVPGTDYRLHLSVTAPLPAPVGSMVCGRIDVHARRIDVVGQGGNFIDPVYGRPRIIQGRVVEADIEQSIVVRTAVPLHVRVRPPQKPGDFAVGTIINFSVDPGATFTPVNEPA